MEDLDLCSTFIAEGGKRSYPESEVILVMLLELLGHSVGVRLYSPEDGVIEEPLRLVCLHFRDP